MSLPGFVHPYDREVELGHGVRAVWFTAGGIGILHACKTIYEKQLMLAPALRIGEGHTVECEDPLTVSPSVLCPDCGLHGYVRVGRWEPC